MPTKTPLNKRRFFVLLIIIAGVFFTGRALALSVFDIEFPIAELGNCADKSACKAYCATPENQTACLEFSQKFGISQSSAKNNNREDGRGNEGQEYGGIDVVKAKAAIAEDGGPGQCGSFEKCGEFCGQAVNAQVCADYGVAHDLFKRQQREEVKKVSAALKNGAKLPGGCKDRESCETICSDPPTLAVAKECIQFARVAGLENSTDLERAEKSLDSLQGGGNFVGNDFRKCQKPKDEATIKQCVDFAEKNGFISAEEAALVRKTGGRGPGGCLGEDCRNYCESEDHGEECQKFAEDNGLVSAEQKQRREEGMRSLRESLENAPDNVKECLANSVGAEKVQGMISGSGRADGSVGSAMRQCFELSAKAAQQNQESGFDLNNDQDSNRMGDDEQDQNQDAFNQRRNSPPCNSEAECRELKEKFSSGGQNQGNQFGPQFRQNSFENKGAEQGLKLQEGMMRAEGQEPRMMPRFNNDLQKMQNSSGKMRPDGSEFSPPMNQGSKPFNDRMPGQGDEFRRASEMNQERMVGSKIMPSKEMMEGQNQNFSEQRLFGPSQQFNQQFPGQPLNGSNFNGPVMMGQPIGSGNFPSGNSGAMMPPLSGSSFPISGGSMPGGPSSEMPPPPNQDSTSPPPSSSLGGKSFIGFLLEPFVSIFN